MAHIVGTYRLTDKDGNVAIIDPFTGSQVMMSRVHYNIHQGNHYFISDVVDLSVNNAFDIRITVPTGTYANFIFRLDSESETEWHLYEDVAITTAGTAITPINNNRNSSNTSNLAFDGIENTSVADANADTNLSGSIQLEGGILGAGRDSGSDSRPDELILSPGKSYVIRIIASAAGYIDYKLRWYE